VFEPNTTLHLVLRPEKAVQTTPSFRAFLVRGDQRIAWSPPATIDSSGSILIEGQTSELFRVEPGAWTMVFVVGGEEDVEGRVLEQKIVITQ
jgi:hypothetical protein